VRGARGLLDVLGIVLAARLASLILHRLTLQAGVDTAGVLGAWTEAERWAISAAVLAPFVLGDPRGAVSVVGWSLRRTVLGFVARFGTFAGLILGVTYLGGMVDRLPNGWLLTWLALGFLLTLFVHWALLKRPRLLSVAVVGAGTSADLIVAHLRRTQGEQLELLGIFDDRASRLPDNVAKPDGTISDLLKLGSQRAIDWVLVTLPGSAETRVLSIVQDLDPLGASVGLSPQALELRLPRCEVDFLGADLPLTLLADGSSQRYQFDDYDLEQFSVVAAKFGTERFGYVVTPNADHLVRLQDDAKFRSLYANAEYVLLDSRLLSKLLRMGRGLELPVCTGSDLTELLFSQVIQPDDQIVLIGGSAEQAQELMKRFGARRLAHMNPPMGFINDLAAVEACINFVESHSPFRFCFVAVGSPQQEIVAQALKQRGIARGLTFCIGASIDFLTGVEQRAPKWMQQLGLEWAFRLMQNPERMAKRYLMRGPRVFGLLPRAQFVLRSVPPQAP